MVFEAAVPVLSVNELKEALQYYQEVLGFQIGWQWGEPPTIGSVDTQSALTISHDHQRKHTAWSI